MKEHFFKEYSEKLGREMDYVLYGESGKLLVAFPSQNGRFYDFTNFQMTDVCAPWIEAGKLRLACPDGNDWESWSAEDRDMHERLLAQERWFSYITDEFLPSVKEKCGADAQGKTMTTGCSMGAVHAANFFFRRPDLFDTCISLSGAYNAYMFFRNTSDPLAYENSPATFLRNMPADHPYMRLYRQSNIILCVGQGAWEDEQLGSTREMESVLKSKGIPAWVDYWGFDCDHDWPWWRKQLPYFLGHVLGSP